MRMRLLGFLGLAVFLGLLFVPFTIDDFVLDVLLALNLGADAELLVETIDLLGNIISFALFAAFITLLVRHWLPGFLAGVILSALVEYVQIFIPERTPSLVDLAADTAGAALGAWIMSRQLERAASGAPARVASEPDLQGQ